MSHIRTRLVQLLFIVLVGLLALPGGALAAPPSFRDKIDFTFDDEICGVTGTSHVSGVQTGRFQGDRFKVTGQVQQVFTSSDGKVVRFHTSGAYTNSFTDNGDGTATILDTYNGRPESISGGHGGPVLQDVGLIMFITVIDINTGEVLSTDVISHGPHPEADSDFTVFCDAFLEALG